MHSDEYLKENNSITKIVSKTFVLSEFEQKYFLKYGINELPVWIQWEILNVKTLCDT